MKNGLVVEKDGTKAWYKDNVLHRENDLPAIEEYDGSKEYWVNGLRHRVGAPAIEQADGKKEYWVNDKVHRLDGPAIIYCNGSKQWWIDDKQCTKAEFEKYLLVNKLSGLT